MFNDTSRYLDDIFTIENPEFEKYIPDIYPTELQFNTSDIETSFLDLNINVNCSEKITHKNGNINIKKWNFVAFCNLELTILDDNSSLKMV